MSDKPDWVADARALCDAATVPPTHTEVPEVESWKAEGCDVVTPSGMSYMRGFGGDLIQVAECVSPGVADFIAAARTAMPRALTALEAADALAKTCVALECEGYYEADDGCSYRCGSAWDNGERARCWNCKVEDALAAYRKARE